MDCDEEFYKATDWDQVERAAAKIISEAKLARGTSGAAGDTEAPQCSSASVLASEAMPSQTASTSSAVLRGEQGSISAEALPNTRGAVLPAIAQLQLAKRKPHSPQRTYSKRQAVCQQPCSNNNSHTTQPTASLQVSQRTGAGSRDSDSVQSSQDLNVAGDWQGRGQLRALLTAQGSTDLLSRYAGDAFQNASSYCPQMQPSWQEPCQHSGQPRIAALQARATQTISLSQGGDASDSQQSARSALSCSSRSGKASSSAVQGHHPGKSAVIGGQERQHGCKDRVPQLSRLQAASGHKHASVAIQQQLQQQLQEGSLDQRVLGSYNTRSAGPGHASKALQQLLQEERVDSSHIPRSVEQAARQPARPPDAVLQQRALQEIRNRVGQFTHVMRTLPPPPPSESRCPGVFKHGKQACGASLEFRTRLIEITGRPEPELVAYYQCSKHDCDYREYPVQRRAKPLLSFEAVSAQAFQIKAAAGAQDVVDFCGGLIALLAAARVDLSSAEKHCPGLLQQRPECGPVKAVLLDLSKYEDIRATLMNQHRLKMKLVERESLIPEPTLVAFRQASGTRVSLEEAEKRFMSIPTPLRKALMPFQREGVMFGLKHNGRALIADEMGVGKTVQAIALAVCYKVQQQRWLFKNSSPELEEEWPLLIVVPASLRLVWAEELERWLPHLRPSTIHIIYNKTNRLPATLEAQVVITSYEMMMRLTCNSCCKGGQSVLGGNPPCSGPEACMAARGFKVIIMDESHTLRTTAQPPDSRHTEAAVSACRRSARAVLLSGTPSLSRPFDLFRQVDALRLGLLGRNREAFSLRYCGRRLVPYGKSGEVRLKYDNSGLSHGSELHSLLKMEVMLRRLKREVMAQLPPKRRQVVRLPAPRPQDWPKQGRATAGESSQEEDAETDRSKSEGEDGQAEEMDDAPATEASQMSPAHKTALAKLPNVIEWLTHALGAAGKQQGSATEAASEDRPFQATSSGPKFLIFAHHRDVMNKLAAALEGADQGWPGAKYVRIDGSTDAIDRRTAVNQFRDDPSITVALLSVTAAGVGLDFCSASAVVFAELPEEVAHVRQAEDRAHRNGQTMPVNVYFLIARSTTDERRWQKLNRSLERVSAVHDGGLDATGDIGGIRIDALHDVCSTQGWEVPRMTQIPSLVPICSSERAEGPVACQSNAGGSSKQARESKEEITQKPGRDESSLALQNGTQLSCAAEIAEKCRPSSANGCTDTGDCPGNAVAAKADSTYNEQPALNDITSDSEDENVFPATANPAERSANAASEAVAGCDSASPVKGQPAAAKVSFEVSANTGRVHFHLAADGLQPLGLSLPLELLLMEGVPASIKELLAALDKRREGSSHVGPAGVLAVPMHMTRQEVEAMIADAKEFAAEWAELRAVLRNRLHGYCLRAPLKDIADEVQAKAAEDGALGQSTSRYLDNARLEAQLPHGAEWRTVRVKYYRRQHIPEYQQAFIGDQRLCNLCMAPVTSCSLPSQAILDGASSLFCSPECETKFCVRSSGGALRRAVFRLERGVCQICKLDCHALVRSLRAIEKGSHRWEAARQRRLVALAPAWAAPRATNPAKRLVKSALEGNAWQADHIVAVFRGGGLCDLDNLRTLCTLCHQEVTRRQAKERAAERKLVNQLTLDAFMKHPGKKTEPKKTRAPLKRAYTSPPAADQELAAVPQEKSTSSVSQVQSCLSFFKGISDAKPFESNSKLAKEGKPAKSKAKTVTCSKIRSTTVARNTESAKDKQLTKKQKSS